MKRKTAVTQLKDLIDDRRSFIHPGEFCDDDIYRQDIKALKKAIKALKKVKS